MIASASQYQPISRWYPDGFIYPFRNLKRLARTLTHAPVAVDFDSSLPASVTRWTFSPPANAGRVAIQFRCESDARQWTYRWRLLAGIIHRTGNADHRIRFVEKLIDLGDGCTPDAPSDLFAFARPRGSRASLIPNPYLLQPQAWLPAALPWERKTETVYFRGVSTGAHEYDRNIRIVLCRTAKSIPGADCRISQMVQVDESFKSRLVEDQLLGGKKPLWEMNRHRYLIDVDGNASSWDRYKFIGLFGGVPIRFESDWEEWWHGFLVDGENYITADRRSLPAVVEQLRSRPRDAYAIAMAAQRVTKTHLMPESARRTLANTLSGIRGC